MNCKIKPTVNLEGCQEIDIGLRHCSGIRVEVLRNTEANLNQDSNCANRNVITLCKYEGWNFNSGNYLFTTDTK